MKQVFKFIGILILFSFFSFSQKGKNINSNLIGIWVYKSHSEEEKEIIFRKRFKFKRKEFGYQFQKNGKLRKRQSVGWCGTPPVKYRNDDGTWKMVNDSILTLKYEYWGGIKEEGWIIIDSNQKELKVKVVEK